MNYFLRSSGCDVEGLNIEVGGGLKTEVGLSTLAPFPTLTTAIGSHTLQKFPTENS